MGNTALRDKLEDITPFNAHGCGSTNSDKSLWHLYDAVMRDSKDPVSVFVFNTDRAKKTAGTKEWDPWSSAIHTLTLMKSYRHPFLLTYVDSVVDKGRKEIYIMTDPVWPLLHVIKSMCSVEILVVLADALRGLTFMHQHGCSHNNVCLDALYVTRSKHLRCVVGGWEFGGMPFGASTRTMLLQTRVHRQESAVTPEESSYVVDYGTMPVHIRDVYGFATMLSMLLVEDTPTMALRRRNAKRPATFRAECSVPAVLASLQQWVKCATSQNMEERAKTSFADLIMLPVFNRSTFLKLNLAFDELLILPRGQKGLLLYRLHWELMKVPFEVFLFRVLPRVLSFPFLCDSDCDVFLPFLLTPMTHENGPVGLLPMPLYKDYVVKFVLRCVMTRRRDAFYIILRHMEVWLPHLTFDNVVDDIAMPLIDGLSDTCENVAHASVESLTLVARGLALCDKHIRFETDVIHLINELILPELHSLAVTDVVPFVRLSATLAVLDISLLHPSFRSDLVVDTVVRALADTSDTNTEVQIHTMKALEALLPILTPTSVLLSVIPSILPLLLHNSGKVRSVAHDLAAKMFAAKWPDNHEPRYERLQLLLAPAGGSAPIRRLRTGQIFSGRVDVSEQAPSPTGHRPSNSLTDYCFDDDYDEEWNAPGILSADQFPGHVAKDWDVRDPGIHPLAFLLPTRSVYEAFVPETLAKAFNSRKKDRRSSGFSSEKDVTTTPDRARRSSIRTSTPSPTTTPAKQDDLAPATPPPPMVLFPAPVPKASGAKVKLERKRQTNPH